MKKPRTADFVEKLAAGQLGPAALQLQEIARRLRSGKDVSEQVRSTSRLLCYNDAAYLNDLTRDTSEEAK